MRILTRYVLWEFLVPFGYCLVGFASIYVLFELFGSFSRMLEAKLPLADAVRYFCGYLAPYFHYIAPAALMLATLYTMWCFCRHSELTAMRASGVSFVAIVKPLLVVAGLMAAFVAYVNERYIPANAHWAAQMKAEKFDLARLAKADNIVYRNARARRTWNVDGIADAAGASLRRVQVAFDREDGSRRMTVSAPRVEYLDGEWWFSDPVVQHYDVRGREMATPSPALDALTLRTFPELDETPADFIMQNRPAKFNSISDRLRYLRAHPDLKGQPRLDAVYDLWAQALSPLACLIITFFAIPAGIATGRQSVFRGILGALAMYFAFYGVTIACMIVAKNGWIHPVACAVLPDALFLGLGVRAFLRQR